MSKLSSIFAFCLALALVLQWGCMTASQKEARFLARGKQRLQQKDYSRAVLEFRNAVRVAPKDDQAYYQLGWAFLQRGDVRDAAVAMKKATELNPQNTAAQVKLAELMVLKGDDDSAKQSEKRMQDILSGSNSNADALAILAIAELRFGDLQGGEQHLGLAIEKFPRNLQSSMILAGLKLELRDFDGAEQILTQAVQHNPQSTEAALALAAFYRMRRRWTEAESEFRKVLDMNPKSASALAGLATVQVQSGQNDRAEQSYRELAALPDKTYKHYHAAYLFQRGQRDAAIAEFAKLASEDPNDRGARTRLVSAYLLTGRQPDAEKVLASALRANPKDVDALLQRAQLFLRNGDAISAQRDLREVLHYSPNSPLAHYLLAKSHQALGQGQQRREELGEALRLQPDLLGVRIELAQADLEANFAKAALQLLDEAASVQKRSIPYIVQRNWALFARSDAGELEKSLKQGLALERAPDLLLQSGLVELARHNYSGARSCFSEALQKSPDDLRSLEGLARSYAEQGQSSVALEKVREYAARRPKSAQIQEYVGEQLLMSGDRTGARNFYNAAKAADPAYTRADLALGQLDLIEGHTEDARRRVSALVSSNRNSDTRNVPAVLMLGDIETGAGDYPAAVQQYEKVLEVSPENVRALNDAAYVLAEYQHQPDKALGYAQRAAELAPDDPAVEDTLGWVLYRKGVYETAVQYLKTATAKSDQVSIRYHLAMAYLKAGQVQMGRDMLAATLKVNSSVPEARVASQMFAEIRK